VLVRTHAKVLNSLPCVPPTAEQYSVGASWGTKGELVEGKRLTTSLQDTFLGTLGKAKGSNREFGDFQQADVICDGADLNNGFRWKVIDFRGLLYDEREGDGRTVNLR
jgi:hypothetical protein